MTAEPVGAVDRANPDGPLWSRCHLCPWETGPWTDEAQALAKLHIHADRQHKRTGDGGLDRKRQAAGEHEDPT